MSYPDVPDTWQTPYQGMDEMAAKADDNTPHIRDVILQGIFGGLAAIIVCVFIGHLGGNAYSAAYQASHHHDDHGKAGDHGKKGDAAKDAKAGDAKKADAKKGAK